MRRAIIIVVIVKALCPGMRGENNQQHGKKEGTNAETHAG
jgi:hypothetical protein